MNAVTIDNLDIKIHTRYAQDQQILDPQFIEEMQLAPALSVIDSYSINYALEFERLFDLHIRNLPWASFAPPLRPSKQKNRYFTHRLVLGILGTECDEEEESEDEADNLIKKAASARKKKFHSMTAFESERTTIINMLSSIKQLNDILGECNSKRLQYQKG